GGPLDSAKDLYGHAFAMFGLAHYYRTFRRREALEIARETSRLLKRHLRLPTGWFAAAAAQDWTVADRSLKQNPHMHLLEAFVALTQASDEPAYKEDAVALAELFHRRLFGDRTGTLGEFFDEAGRPHAETGRLVEPGHHFEWYWLLHEGADLWRDVRAMPAAERLFAWAERYGVDRELGGVFDLLDREGRVVKDTKRIWPQAERIKAYALRARIALPSKERENARRTLVSLLEFLFARYLLADGGWRESLDRTLIPRPTALPATTPYHLFLALSEALTALGA
ncbi:MAG: AGE family epimerase/isomerase, partial [Alphaproteobacteria bacterium]